MRASAFVFLRGTCHLFYDRLPKSGICKSAPMTWCCGDLHLENFGSYKGDNRLVYFDINDFDEAALAPASWELSRIITSIMVSAHSFDKTTENAKKLSKQLIEAYAEALLTGKARWVERETSHRARYSAVRGRSDRRLCHRDHGYFTYRNCSANLSEIVMAAFSRSGPINFF
jgi:uncharacterized protein (DUF2252 family)